MAQVRHRASTPAIPAAAAPDTDGRDLLDLCAEISRLRGEADVIEAEGVWPLEQEVERILCGAGTRRERMDAADACAVQSGLRQAGSEVSRLVAQAEALTERVLDCRRTPRQRAGPRPRCCWLILPAAAGKQGMRSASKLCGLSCGNWRLHDDDRDGPRHVDRDDDRHGPLATDKHT